MNNECVNCIHEEICKHKKNYRNDQRSIDEVLRITSAEGYPFIVTPITLNCKYYMRKMKIEENYEEKDNR